MLFPRSIAGLAVFFRHFAQGWGEEKKKRERQREREKERKRLPEDHQSSHPTQEKKRKEK